MKSASSVRCRTGRTHRVRPRLNKGVQQLGLAEAGLAEDGGASRRPAMLAAALEFADATDQSQNSDQRRPAPGRGRSEGDAGAARGGVHARMSRPTRQAAVRCRVPTPVGRHFRKPRRWLQAPRCASIGTDRPPCRSGAGGVRVEDGNWHQAEFQCRRVWPAALPQHAGELEAPPQGGNRLHQSSGREALDRRIRGP